MRSIFCIFLVAVLTLPAFAQTDENWLLREVVISDENPRMVIECAALLGKITIGENDPAPLYATILHAVFGEDMGEWDSAWQTFFLLFTAAAADCVNYKTSADEQVLAGESSDDDAGESTDGGLEFSSAANGQEPLLGPITLPTGIYIVSLESDGYASAEFEAVAECDGEMAYGMLIYQDEGKVQERLDIDSDCRLTILVDSSNDWKLTIEELEPTDEAEEDAAGEIEHVGLEFSSVADGQEPLLGPITLPTGIYIVSLESNGYASAEFEAVAECDGEMAYGMLIYQAEGKVQERLDIESDCRLTILVDASDDWALLIEPL